MRAAPTRGRLTSGAPAFAGVTAAFAGGTAASSGGLRRSSATFACDVRLRRSPR
jgi:hypothetical protein